MIKKTVFFTHSLTLGGNIPVRIFGHLTIHRLRRKSPNWRIAAKLQLQPNDKIFDIGCDWGGLAVTLSSVEPGISLTGITFSENQHAYATTVVKP